MILSRSLRLAYRLLRVAALEDRIQLLTKKYPQVPEEGIRKLSGVDPTGGKYLEWLVRNYEQGLKGLLANNLGDQSRQMLQFYQKATKSSRLAEYLDLPMDINRLKLGDLYVAWFRNKDRDLDSERQRVEKAKKMGSKIIYDQGGYKVVKIGGEGVDLDQAAIAACIYAKGTKWCTSQENTAKRYLSNSPLYVVIKDGKKIMQTDLNSFMDELDNYINFHKSPELVEVLVKSGVLDDPELIVSLISRGSLVLGQRLPGIELVIARSAKASLDYASFIKERFPLGEKAIIDHIPEDPTPAFLYVIRVLKGRFPEAEPALKQNPEYWGDYLSLIKIWEGSGSKDIT